MYSSKDELLGRIVEAEKALHEKESVIKEAEADYNNKQPLFELTRYEYDRIKKQYDDLQAEMQDALSRARNAKYGISTASSQLDMLKRELARMLDSEALEQAFIQQVEDFKNRCLSASWRKENRADGTGAMPHQIEGAIHMAIAKQGVLADAPGLGKTLTSLIYCDFIEAKRVIAIVPNATVGNFMRECAMWSPHRTVVQLGGQNMASRDILIATAKHLDQFVLVLSYTSWRRDKKLIDDLISLQADTLIMDEAHHVKSTETLACRGAFKLRYADNICPKCDSTLIMRLNNSPVGRCGSCNYESKNRAEFSTVENVLPMTGTPILNKPQEVYPLVHMVDSVNFPKSSAFMYDFCRQLSQSKWTWGYGGEKRLVEKIGKRFLQRSRKDAGVIIPPNTIVEHAIDYDDMKNKYPRQAEAYQQVRDYAQLMLNPDNGHVMSMPKMITILLRLRQVITAPSGIKFTDYDPETDRMLNYEFEVKDSIKLDKVEEIAKECIESGERVVIFSQFTEPLLQMKERLGSKCALYIGSTSKDERTVIEQDFDPKFNSHKYDVVCVNYKTGSEGLNLNAATNAIMIDREWNPGREQQAIHRINRLGTVKDTTTHLVEVEDTVDTWLSNLIAEKKALIGGFENEARDFQSRLYQALKDGEL